MKPTVLFTGGHHNSALEVALKLRDSGWDVVWIGHRYSLWGDTRDSAEYREVTQNHIPFIELKAGKLYRTFNPIKLIRLPYGFIQAFFEIFRLKSKFKVKGVYSSGGYLAVPVVFSAWLLGIPILTHEQTIIAGWANRFVSHFAKKIATSWPENLNHYPKEKVVFTGLPLRQKIIELVNRRNLTTLNSSLKTIYITGGKQGSHFLNELIFSSLSKLTQKYKIIHQTGTNSVYRDFEKSQQFLSNNYQSFDYDNQKALSAFEASEIVIGRAGAHTVYELAVLGKKSVFIPLSHSSHQEQLLNAKFLAQNGLAVVLPQSEANQETLLKSITDVERLSPTPLTLPLDATDTIVDLIKGEFL